jgi:TetR/AcrR family transcriptional regulator, transcriptional repressor for nem operon
MRYSAEHKTEVHQRIVADAARRLRAEGLNGAAVAAVMRDTGLTHGGFYKHFRSKDDLLVESLREAFREFIGRLVAVAEEARPCEAWRAIVKAYLSPEYSDHAEFGCPLTALAPEFARGDTGMRNQILSELVTYRDRMLPFMPGRRKADKERAFFQIFSTMIGAVELARMLPEPVRDRVLISARDLLLYSF